MRSYKFFQCNPWEGATLPATLPHVRYKDPLEHAQTGELEGELEGDLEGSLEGAQTGELEGELEGLRG